MYESYFLIVEPFAIGKGVMLANALGLETVFAESDCELLVKSAYGGAYLTELEMGCATVGELSRMLKWGRNLPKLVL